MCATESSLGRGVAQGYAFPFTGFGTSHIAAWLE
jgi:hypothetical protein